MGVRKWVKLDEKLPEMRKKEKAYKTAWFALDIFVKHNTIIDHIKTSLSAGPASSAAAGWVTTPSWCGRTPPTWAAAGPSSSTEDSR